MTTVKYAGFWVRFIASFFDTLFLALPIAVVVYFVSDGAWFDLEAYQNTLQMAMSANPNALQNQPQTSLEWEFLFEGLVLLMTLLFWKKYEGTTPGKKYAGIKIVDAKTLTNISTKQAITRSFGYIVSSIPFFIGFLFPLFRADKRALHDLLAGTVVIYHNGSISDA